MRRRLHAVLILAVAVSVAVAASAGAANPRVIHLNFPPVTNTNDDFCGTGRTVTDVFSGRSTVWLEPNQPLVDRTQGVFDDVFTNPSNGATVIVHFASGFTDTLIPGDPSGLNTHEWVFKGLAELIRGGNGGVLGRDAGRLVVDTTWNGPEFSEGGLVSFQVVVDRGGHPGFFTNRDCNVMVPALGLS